MLKTQEQVFVAVRKCPNPTAALKVARTLEIFH
jgi:hypothetical protein